MGSRQVTLLTKGYLRGHLSFVYPHKQSWLREAIILEQIEKEEISSALSARLMLETSTISISPKEGIKKAADTLEKFFGLKLPYTAESSKINTASGPMTDEEKAYWKNIHMQRRKAKSNDSPTTS